MSCVHHHCIHKLSKLSIVIHLALLSSNNDYYNLIGSKQKKKTANNLTTTLNKT